MQTFATQPAVTQISAGQALAPQAAVPQALIAHPASIGQATATQPSFEDCVVYALPRYSVSMRNLLFLCVKLFIGSSYAMWLSHYESSFTMRLMLHETVRHGESYTLIRPS